VQTVHRSMRATFGVKGLNPKEWDRICSMHEKIRNSYNLLIREATDNVLKETVINPLNAELNPMCCLLVLLGAHHFLHVSRIRVKSLTLRLLMSYIYMEHPFLTFLDHTF